LQSRPAALLLARALSSGGRRAVERYWRSHSSDASSDLGGLGPAAAYVAAYSDQGMLPGAFERLFCGGRRGGRGRLADWPEWRARALRDALDPKKCGLLSAEAFGLAVAMLAASSSTASTEGGREVEEDDCGLQRRRLRERLWRALAAEEAGKDATDAQSPDPSSSIPLASVWTCALLMGAEERHLTRAWRQNAGDREDDGNSAPPPPAHLTALQAEALVAGALRAQNHDPAKVALSAPCCEFEWAGVGDDVEGGASLPAAVDGHVPAAAPPTPFAPPAAAPCCGCVLS
jgi:hypothetical protein